VVKSCLFLLFGCFIWTSESIYLDYTLCVALYDCNAYMWEPSCISDMCIVSVWWELIVSKFNWSVVCCITSQWDDTTSGMYFQSPSNLSLMLQQQYIISWKCLKWLKNRDIVLLRISRSISKLLIRLALLKNKITDWQSASKSKRFNLGSGCLPPGVSARCALRCSNWSASREARLRGEATQRVFPLEAVNRAGLKSDSLLSYPVWN